MGIIREDKNHHKKIKVVTDQHRESVVGADFFFIIEKRIAPGRFQKRILHLGLFLGFAAVVGMYPASVAVGEFLVVLLVLLGDGVVGQW